jgi:hypothetical protein
MVVLTIFFVAFVLVIVIAVPVLGGFGNKSGGKKRSYNYATSLDRGYVQTKWADIEATANLGGPAHLKASVMDADKLVEYVLSAKIAEGHTFADKLKVGKKLFRNYDDYDNLWYAHKVRNSIAHDNGVDFSIGSAQKAIGYFKQALKAMGAL